MLPKIYSWKTENVLYGLDIPYKVISHVGYDFKYLSKCFFTSFLFKESKTTRFINYISTLSRRQKIVDTCAPIMLNTNNICNSNISIVSGVMDEVPFSTIKNIRNKSQILIGDIQGFIRTKNLDNDVINLHIKDTANSESILKFDYIKTNEEEVNFID
ncbi:MAG: hypothetical protein NQ127_01205 [Candidatus Cardinium sp.]|nr:hypothetical protein [Candidatus Cardinium sp.]